MPITKFTAFPTLSDFPVPFRLFEDALTRMVNETDSSVRPWVPAVDIQEDEDKLSVKVDLPGVAMEDIDISFENGTLTLKGQRQFERKDEKSGYHRIERSYGSFARSFSMPDTVDPEKVTAEYNNGVLEITLAKKEIAKPRSIKVQLNKQS